MLGNWSFGDYFKKEAIAWSWELLTKEYGLNPDRMYVTYFEGDKASGLEPDLEAKELWLSVGVPEDHILSGNMKDNFWEMGDQGPCGPCSEIHYDRIGGRNAAHLVNMDDPNVLEIWNNVFIQYNRESDKSLRPLPAKSIDTGMGFERLVGSMTLRIRKMLTFDIRCRFLPTFLATVCLPPIFCGVDADFSIDDTDVFSPLFDRIQEITGVRKYEGKFGSEDADGIDTAYRVVADHVRLLTFAISDGGIPNNMGRGYVVRRVLRRGARYARKYLNTEIGSFFSKIVPTLVAQMGDMFPEIKKKEQDVKEILDEEELSFAKTLDRGEAMFEKYAQQCKENNTKSLSGSDVWRLYDTYGFPVDLTQLMAEERGLTINEEEVNEAQAKAKEASKGEKKAGADLVKLDVHDLGKLDGMTEVTKTDDEPKFGRGNITSEVKAIYYNRQFLSSTSEIPEGEQFGVILDKTNFYAEQGGQENDTGKILIDGEAELDVQNVQSYGGYILHTGYMTYGTFKTGDSVICEYDELRRHPIRNNHTGTHILNFALRAVLGDDINQKGSLVAPEKLRFDFSHKAAVSDKELQEVENKSTSYIRQNSPVYSLEVPLATARNIKGVRAVFGETYPDPVRVVSVGVPVEQLLEDVHNPEWENVSVEFCGGTHVDKTGEIKELIILEEGGIAKGIRRIIAVTGQAAHEVQRVAQEFSDELALLEKMSYSPQKEQKAKQLQVQLNQLTISAVTKTQLKERFAKVAKVSLPDCRCEKLITDSIQANLDQQKAFLKAENKAVTDTIAKHFTENPESKRLVVRVPISANSKAISEAIKTISSKQKDKTIYLIAADESEGKVVHGCHVSAEAKEKGADAPAWANEIAGVLGGKAGGKGATSLGQGTQPENVDQAVELATKYLEKLGL